MPAINEREQDRSFAKLPAQHPGKHGHKEAEMNAPDRYVANR
jgi:hypothetical protein